MSARTKTAHGQPAAETPRGSDPFDGADTVDTFLAAVAAGNDRLADTITEFRSAHLDTLTTEQAANLRSMAAGHRRTANLLRADQPQS